MAFATDSVVVAGAVDITTMLAARNDNILKNLVSFWWNFIRRNETKRPATRLLPLYIIRFDSFKRRNECTSRKTPGISFNFRKCIQNVEKNVSGASFCRKSFGHVSDCGGFSTFCCRLATEDESSEVVSGPFDGLIRWKTSTKSHHLHEILPSTNWACRQTRFSECHDNTIDAEWKSSHRIFHWIFNFRFECISPSLNLLNKYFRSVIFFFFYLFWFDLYRNIIYFKISIQRSNRIEAFSFQHRWHYIFIFVFFIFYLVQFQQIFWYNKSIRFSSAVSRRRYIRTHKHTHTRSSPDIDNMVFVRTALPCASHRPNKNGIVWTHNDIRSNWILKITQNESSGMALKHSKRELIASTVRRMLIQLVRRLTGRERTLSVCCPVKPNYNSCLQPQRQVITNRSDNYDHQLEVYLCK